MKTVLIVDDSKIYRTAIALLFAKLGWAVCEAEDGLDGHNILKKMTVDLVVLDIVMPRLDGFALCRRIRDNPKTKHIPIIICSSKNELADKYLGLKQGANHYLTKPTDAKAIIGAVKKIFQDEPIQFSSQKRQPNTKVDRLALNYPPMALN